MNNQFPSKDAVQRLREQYPEGTRIELVSMDDPYSKLRPGDKGTVSRIDDIGTVFCRWDSGSGLGLVYGEDHFKKAEAIVQDTPRYVSGADFWRDTAASHGAGEARDICGRYLDTQLRIEQPPEEHQFCRELFSAMYEDSARTVDHARLVYPYDFQKANDRTEQSYYHDSRKMNAECARAIDDAVHASCYKVNYYNLDIAAMKAVHDYGFERVNLVLARNIQLRDYDGRFSDSNKQWAQGYEMPEKAFGDVVLNAHPVLLDSFVNHTRNLYEELNAERFALPGRPESGETVQGYEIVRAVEFNDQRGFAIGLNPDAVNQFVAWQFTTENGARDYYWGKYSDEFADAALNYTARVIVHTSDERIKEVERAFDYEKNTEQNYNMIDGRRNNEGVPKPDLTDGQTYEEIRELAPEMLPDGSAGEPETPLPAIGRPAEKNAVDDKLSVMALIKTAQKTPNPPRESKPEKERKPQDREL